MTRIGILDRSRAVFFLILLVYAPWHDSYTLGQRAHLSKWFSFLSDTSIGEVAIAGAFNFAWIALLSVLVALPLWRSYKNSPPKLIDGFIISFALMRIFWIRIFDMTSLQAALNAILISMFFLALCRPSVFDQEVKLLKTWGLRILTHSLGLAMVLPLLIKVKKYPVFILLFPVLRYRGWLGEGQPIAWIGMLVAVWSLWCFLIGQLKIGQLIPVFFFGAAAVYFNVLRISMLLIVVYCFVAGYFSFGKFKLRSFLVFALGFACIYSLNTGEYRKKNWILGMGGGQIPVYTFFYNINSLDALQQAMSELKRDYERDGAIAFDKLIVTTGRAGTYDYLVKQSQGHRLFGQGTGSSQRLLRAYKPWAPEPNNEYLRIFYEHGYFGLGLMLFLFISLARYLRFTWALPGLIMFYVGMLTDAPLIIPAFGYGPICLFLLICASQTGPFEWGRIAFFRKK